MANVHIITRAVNSHGGAEVYNTGLARRLADRGHAVTFICNECARGLSGLGDVHVIARPAAPDIPIAWRGHAWYETASYSKAIGRLGLRRPDLVIASAPQLLWGYCRTFDDVSVVYLPHALVAPLEVKVHLWPDRLQRWANTSLYYCLERWALRRAFTTIRFTHAACRAMENYYGRGVTRTWTILAVPVTLPPPRVRPLHADGPVRLLSVGRLVETKNLAFLLRVLANLGRFSWLLEVVGDGPQREVLEAMSRSYSLQDRICFRGHQLDLDKYYRTADLFLFPSRLESLGLVLLEAMSYGLPTLSMRSDGKVYRNVTHEIVTPNQDGILAGSEQEFGAMLETLLQNWQWREQVGSEARRTIEKKHRWDAHLDSYEALIARAKQRSPTCII
jgi:glycosyltransferase involved in cell wall biosynthesis